MVTMPHGERPRRLPGFSAERVLIVLGGLGIVVAIILALVSWHGA